MNYSNCEIKCGKNNPGNHTVGYFFNWFACHGGSSIWSKTNNPHFRLWESCNLFFDLQGFWIKSFKILQCDFLNHFSTFCAKVQTSAVILIGRTRTNDWPNTLLYILYTCIPFPPLEEGMGMGKCANKTVRLRCRNWFLQV